MLLLKVVGTPLKYGLREFAITAGTFIMMPFNLMEVLDDFRFLRKNGADVGPPFITV